MSNPKQSFGKLIPLIVVLCLLLVIYSGWQRFGSALYRSLVDRRQEYLVLQDQLHTMELLLETSQNPSTNAEMISPVEDTGLFQLAADSELPQVLAKLEKLLSGFPGQVETVRTGEIGRNQLIDSVKIDITLAGSTSQVLNLLRELESFPSYLIISSLTGDYKDGGPRFDLTIHQYYFNETLARQDISVY